MPAERWKYNFGGIVRNVSLPLLADDFCKVFKHFIVKHDVCLEKNTIGSAFKKMKF